jgi:polyamine oxidase
MKAPRNVFPFGRRLTRRECLILGAAGPAAGLGAWARAAAPATDFVADDGRRTIAPAAPGKLTRVVVIGAGFAGLAAAKALRSAGVPVTVIEARDRIGGRANTVQFGNSAFDLGAAWIHEHVGNPLTELARRLGARTVNFDPDRLLRTGASVFDQSLHRWLSADDCDEVLAAAAGISTALPALASALGAEASVAMAIDAYTATLPLVDVQRERVHDILFAQASVTWGTAAEHLWLGAALIEEPYRGSDVLVVGGFRVLLDALAQGLDLRLGARVTHVLSGPQGVAVHLAGGQVEQASHAIVTLPLGVLKAGSVVFDPPLPADKASAIQQLGFGRFEKLLLRFPRRFWKPELKSLYVPVRTGPDEPIQAWFDWTQKAQPTLIGFATGTQGERFTSLAPHEAVAAGLAQLRAAFPASFVDPTETLASSWGADPLTLGAYPYLASSAGATHVRALAEPQGRLLFAGDATNWPRYQVTDGAFTSGIREAKRLLRQTSVTLHLNDPPR